MRPQGTTVFENSGMSKLICYVPGRGYEEHRPGTASHSDNAFVEPKPRIETINGFGSARRLEATANLEFVPRPDKASPLFPGRSGSGKNRPKTGPGGRHMNIGSPGRSE